MKKLRNTLFVLSEDAYLTLDGENVVVNREKQVVARYPLHTLTTILSFSYAGASPALMGACAQREIGLSFCSPRGKFLARVANQSNGNVLLRRTQYRMADDPLQSCQIARAMVLGKLYNARWSIERTCRDHAMRVDVDISGGFADGQTICDTRAYPDRPVNVRVALGADRPRFVALIKQLLKAVPTA